MAGILGKFSEASDMSADEVAEVFQFECEIDVVDGDGGRDLEDDRREVEHSLDAGHHEAVDHGLGILDGHAEDREFDGFLGDEFLQVRVGENRDGHSTGAGGFRIRVERGDDFESFLLEAMIAQQRGAEIPRADEDDRLEVFAAESLTNDRGERLDRVAEAAGTELAEVGEVLAELCGLDSGGAGEGGGADGGHAVIVEFLKATVIDGKPVDGLFRDVNLADFFGEFHGRGKGTNDG